MWFEKSISLNQQPPPPPPVQLLSLSFWAGNRSDNSKLIKTAPHDKLEQPASIYNQAPVGAATKPLNSIMEIYNNILCISSSEMIISQANTVGVVAINMYRKLTRERVINVVRRGCYTTPALIEYASLPQRYRTQWERMHGDPNVKVSLNPLIERLRADDQALKFYTDYTLGDGTSLPLERQVQYANEAAVLRAMREAMSVGSAFIKACGGSRKVSWDKVAELIHGKQVQTRFPHSLPTNTQSLRRKFKKFEAEGYPGLIHSAYGNDHALKVSVMIERLILSLYTMPNKPFGADVFQMYNLFVGGNIEVYDKSSGELFDRGQFVKNGNPIELSEKTIWGVINNNYNRTVVDSVRNDDLYNKRVHRPHHHRKPPVFALSKISMDDRDLPRKTHNGQRVKAYYAYDVASGCVIGRSYSRTKDDALFLECLRDMLRMLKRSSLPMPAEVEVEHHIVNHFRQELDLMFPIVRWCGAGNSQEKHAEHLNRAKKYGIERKRHNDIGRWWARSEAYLTRSKREGAEYVTKTYDYDVVVAEDIQDVKEFNNSLHPKQNKYPGMTRWQVLLHHVNQELAQPNDAVVYKCIGNKTESTVCNNQYMKVQYAEYQLPTPQHISRLKPNNYSVEAYWLPDAEGHIGQVYVYQGDVYVGCCQKIDRYNTARTEWTEKDKQAYAAQSAFVSQFDTRVKKGKHEKLDKLGLIEVDPMQDFDTIEAKVTEQPGPMVEDSFDSLLYPSTIAKNAASIL